MKVMSPSPEMVVNRPTDDDVAYKNIKKVSGRRKVLNDKGDRMLYKFQECTQTHLHLKRKGLLV